MECPICRTDKRTTIDETRHNKETNENMRRYVCVDCGREFDAIDMLVKVDENYAQDWTYWNRSNTRGRYHGGKNNG